MEANNFDNYRLYVLVNQQYPPSVAVNSASHGAMNAILSWKGETLFDGWLKHSFKKVTCMVNEKEMQNIKNVMIRNDIKYIDQTENRLNKAHILTVCYPIAVDLPQFRAFKFLRLYKWGENSTPSSGKIGV